jgi:hypothetical protein
MDVLVHRHPWRSRAIVWSTFPFSYVYFISERWLLDQAQWLIPLILATWETEIGGSLFEASPSKKIGRPYIKNRLVW